ncbi:MAG: hypothetical protein JXD19_05030 [Deltaproteobacteria bacterium]|nr:hypothetical protein [Deltaproteobacteria bacterium]
MKELRVEMEEHEFLYSLMAGVRVWTTSDGRLTVDQADGKIEKMIFVIPPDTTYLQQFLRENYPQHPPIKTKQHLKAQNRALYNEFRNWREQAVFQELMKEVEHRGCTLAFME